MQQATFIAFWFALALYAAATVLYVYYFTDKRRKLALYATFGTGAGFIVHTGSIVLRWADQGRFPLQGVFDSLSLAAWALVLIYFIVEHLAKVRVLGALLVPTALVGMVIAQFYLSTPVGHAAEVLDNWRVGIHVVLVNLANAGFALGAAASILYLIQERQLKHHTTNVLFRRLPPLASTDKLARRAIAYAFPAYTAAILLGTLRAVEFDLQGWYFDPRVMLAGIVWLIFGFYLLLRYRKANASARAYALVAIAGLVVVIALMIVARTVPSGFHIFGV
jgi:ABC-type transport system involved in cytochrome c biogenesis permease subunit